MGRARMATNDFIFVIFAVLEIQKVSILLALCLCLFFCEAQDKRIRLDPDNEGSDGADDQGISEDEFTLNIKRGADDVSKDNSSKNDDVKKSFHTGTILMLKNDYIRSKKLHC